MKRNHILGMACGYYLSRFDAEAYRSLGLGNQQETHRALARALSVPGRSIRNWRDEFDPIHDNDRMGWHKREMAPSRVRMVELLGGYSQVELLALVEDAIRTPTGPAAVRFLDSSWGNDSD
ncbi:MAG TPA: hypothetical protein PLR91_02355 [Kiritimatiellia bacterium]|jgi:hypothetical protein|nr:hypothetical protein [Kiritimatiellia bacterium]